MPNKIDTEQAVFFLSANGPLAKNNPLYEERSVQLDLTKKIATCFNESKIGTFEAGTGVGKSYAYLIPALMWAKENDQRIVISTGTINLQQQLYEKDILKAQEITGIDEKFVLLKGRQNYVCLRRLKDVLDEKDMFSEYADELDLIYDWVKSSKTGSKSELYFMPSDSLWQRINSESDACMGAKCYYADRCFVQKMRKEAYESKILIVNHHLLFSDIQVRLNSENYDDIAVLPPYKHLIFDEAHGIDDSATSFFSESLTKFSLLKQCNMLYRRRRSSIGGLLFNIMLLSGEEVDIDDLVTAIEECIDTMRDLENIAFSLIENKYTWRLYEATANSAGELIKGFYNLERRLCEFIDLAYNIFCGLREKDFELPSVWETLQILKRLEGLASFCKNFQNWEEREESVFWMEKRRLSSGEYFIRFVETPLDIAGTMNYGVFEPMKSVVCVSATLQVANDFNFWKYRTGINFQPKERILSSTLESPFPYKENLLFSIVSDAPSPTYSSFSSWMEEAVLQLILASKGRALVLFTSYDSLKYAYEHCSVNLVKNGYTVYKQGDDDRFRLLKSFKEDVNSILFATDSFWEGVDIRGEALSHVIIVKLPFAVPNDPVIQARCEKIEKNGGNSFMDYSVPKAVIQFKQGFGRLLRSTTDFGCVTVLDNRLIQKNYGKFFIDSVPQSKMNIAPLSEVLTKISEFLS